MNIENKKQVGIIALAVGLGLIAAILVGNYMQESIKQETAMLSKSFEEKKVEPLKQQIKILKTEMDKMKKIQSTLPARALDQRATETPEVPKSSLALRTPAGKRAYTIMIDSLSAVGGLINPGDYVDVIAHLEMPDPATDKKKERVSSIVFQNIQILAVGTNLQAPGGYEEQQKARSLNVTLALTPEEAGLMAFIEKNGTMQMALRGPAETETQIMQASNWETLSEYVFEKQGTELVIPKGRAILDTADGSEVENFIEIFRGGKEL